MKKKYNVLITNDDGIYGDGLNHLIETLQKSKFINKLTIVVPDREKSAVSHSLSLHTPLRLTNILKNVYVCDGTPSDCVDLGLFEINKNNKIDFVVSGINQGPNLGEDVFYSGTVAGILEARMHNVSGIAFSQFPLKKEKTNIFPFKKSAKLAIDIIDMFLPQLTNKKQKISLNVNFPAKPPQNIKKLKMTFLDHRHYPGNIIKRIDPMGTEYHWIGGIPPKWDNKEGSDYNTIKQNLISVTPLKLDITDYNIVKANII